MRTVLQAAALVCLVIAGFIGFGIIEPAGRTVAENILLAVGWGGWGAGLFVGSFLVGDWP